MRIELADPWGTLHTITSMKPNILGLWIDEQLDLINANANSWRLRMWAETEQERIAMNANTYDGLVNRSNLYDLSKIMTGHAKMKGNKNMSDVGWCDYRDHAYKRDPDNENVLTIKGETKEICPECAAELGLIDEYVAPASPAARKASITKAIGNGGS